MLVARQHRKLMQSLNVDDDNDDDDDDDDVNDNHDPDDDENNDDADIIKQWQSYNKVMFLLSSGVSYKTWFYLV